MMRLDSTKKPFDNAEDAEAAEDDHECHVPIQPHVLFDLGVIIIGQPQEVGQDLRPTSPDFSGWNCTPATWPRWTIEANGCPWSVTATVSGVIGATKLWVK